MVFARWIVSGWIVQLAAMISYCEFGRVSLMLPGKYVIGGFALLAIGILLNRIFTKFGLLTAILSIAIFVVGAVLMEQILAFTIYPGLVKDVDFLSGDHQLMIIRLLLVTALVHALLFITVIGLKQFRLKMLQS